MTTYDLDAMAAQYREAVGGDDVRFSFAGKEWSFPHPMFADDEWKNSLPDASEGDVAQAEAMMGEEQYERFREAGGSAGLVMLLVAKVQREARDVVADEDGKDRPTRRSISSRRRRKR